MSLAEKRFYQVLTYEFKIKTVFQSYEIRLDLNLVGNGTPDTLARHLQAQHYILSLPNSKKINKSPPPDSSQNRSTFSVSDEHVLCRAWKGPTLSEVVGERRVSLS